MPINTNVLKSFAPKARKKLIQLISNKIDFVLEADTPELREKHKAVKELRNRIKAEGKEQTVEHVAYTWFNRFIALRYMDVNDFQPLGILIITGAEESQTPELLSLALGGNIPDLLNVDKTKIFDLLQGRLQSTNPQSEVYAILLTAACNHLHETFPFLFESINDYTELLLPDDLLSGQSILEDVRMAMTKENCEEVEVIGWLYQFYISDKKDEVFGSKGKVKKEEIPAATQLFTPRWIVEYMVQNTVGKLWVLNHPNSKLKEHMPYYIESELTANDVLTIHRPEELTLLDQACGSGHILVYGFELFYKIYAEEGYAASDIPGLIIEHNLHGFEIDERAAQLAGIAILMKAQEYQRRLFRKSEVPEPNIICFKDLTLSDEEIQNILKNTGVEISDELLHDLQNMRQATNFGSLIAPLASLHEIQNVKGACLQFLDKADLFERGKLKQLMIALETVERLGTKVACVVDNPPYMGNSNYNKELKDFVYANYPDSKSDLMAAFIESGLKISCEKGYIGMINQHSWMFLSSYERLRGKLIEESFIDTLLHLGPRTFPEIGGEVVQNASFTINNSDLEKAGVFFRLVDFKKPDLKNTKTIEAIQASDSQIIFKKNQTEFKKIPGESIGYWANAEILKNFEKGTVDDFFDPRVGMATASNKRFVRQWTEVEKANFKPNSNDREEAEKSNCKWFPFTMGGTFRKWYGNVRDVVNWQNDGDEIRKFTNEKGKVRSHNYNLDYIFNEGLTWTVIGTSKTAFRYTPKGHLFSNSGYGLWGNSENSDIIELLGFLNSSACLKYLEILSPTMGFESGYIRKLPYVGSNAGKNYIEKSISTTKLDWDCKELSWDFQRNELIRLMREGGIDTLEDAYEHYRQYWTNKFFQLHQNEDELNRQFIEIYGLEDELTLELPLDEITILQEELDSKKLKKKDSELRRQQSEGRNPVLPFMDKEVFAQFISYAVGCMFGRYSLDKEGLILANQGETLEDYLKKVEKSKTDVTFLPDNDNIIPVLEGEWFEDDIVTRMKEFLKTSFGMDHYRENLRFLEDALGKDLRTYFLKAFFKGHVKRYNKRPIYWKFSSPQGYFSVLIYMHRYTSDTLSLILNKYLKPYIQKLEARKSHYNNLKKSGTSNQQREASRELGKLTKMIDDCKHYAQDILYPLATARITIDLDDGVLVNYNKFGEAVEEVKSLNDKKKKAKVKEFDWIDTSEIR